MKSKVKKSEEPTTTATVTPLRPDDRQTQERILITPDLAKKWLGGKERNRSLRDVVVKKYAEDMKLGRWLLTGDSIKFNKQSRCIDGQHRLAAIVASEVSVWSWITWNVDDTAMEVIDCGRRRSTGDTLHILGYGSSYKLASMARWLITIKYGMSSTKIRQGGSSNREVAELVSKHPNMQESLQKSARSVGMSPSLLSTIHYVGAFLLNKPDEADAYVLTFTRGISNSTFYPDPESDPALKLRETYMRKNRGKYCSDAGDYRAAIRCWNIYAKHEPYNRSFVIPATPQRIDFLNVDLI